MGIPLVPVRLHVSGDNRTLSDWKHAQEIYRQDEGVHREQIRQEVIMAMLCVAHLNAADFGPIQVDSGLMPVRPTCVAGAKAPTAGL